MKMVKKDYYFISGYTTANRYVTVGMWTTLELAIDAFRKKYPRFRGIAHIEMVESDYCTESRVYMYSASNKFEDIYTFNRTKDLAELVKNTEV
jgi:hypothetical protein